jgi:hypothetical protein
MDPVTVEVRHRHVRHGSEGVLCVGDDSIAFEEGGKHKDHSRKWHYNDIEQLTLSPDVLRILTYENSRWKFGGDREFVFDSLPEDFATKLYPIFSRRLDQRFVAALADDINVLWQVPVKLLRLVGGSQGALLVGTDHLVYRTPTREGSRTWRIGDIDMISSSGLFDLTIVTFERSEGSYTDHKDFHFQLKRPLTEAQYEALWRKVNQTKGLKILN